MMHKIPMKRLFKIQPLQGLKMVKRKKYIEIIFLYIPWAVHLLELFKQLL